MKRGQRLYLLAAALACAAFVLASLLLGSREPVVITYPAPVMATTTLSGATELPKETFSSALAAAPVAATPPRPSLEPAAMAARNAVVNILCVGNGSPFKPISGSGVIIDERGIVLTTAHIAQYFLLRDYPRKGSITCSMRTGSPAVATFSLDLLYVSTHWITANQGTLAEAKPLGTGESDFALLYATESLSGAPLPRFPTLQLAGEGIASDAPVVVAGYAAESLSDDEILNNLNLTADAGIVEKRYTFGADSADLISVRGSAAAQVGASGGAVAGSDGRLAGLITTTSPEPDVAKRSVRAITPVHMRDRFVADTGFGLDSFLASASPRELAARFSERAASLRDLLIKSASD